MDNTLPSHVKTTPRTEIDAALSRLHSLKDDWVSCDLEMKQGLLRQIGWGFQRVGEKWVRSELRSKGFPEASLAEAEEWIFLAGILRSIRMIQETLSEMRRYGSPRLPHRVRDAAEGRRQARVFPRRLWDRLLFRGVHGYVRFEPGPHEPSDRFFMWDAAQYLRGSGKVALVLGAGNASMLPIVDVLHRLFIERQVVLLKPNPINAHLGPLIEEACRALIRLGFLQVVYGPAEEGAYLTTHPLVDEIHLTGSHKTYEAIVFGPGEEAGDQPGQTKSARQPVNSRPMICELGNISPIIIVPGPWREADLREQAGQLATWLVANAGFGCLTPRLIIQHREWQLRDRFLDAFGVALANEAARPAYYPGALDLHAAFLKEHPRALLFGESGRNLLPWTIIPNLDPARTDDICFAREAFCGLCAETGLSAPDTASFLDRAVDFTNRVVWGNLNATLIVHPESSKNPAVAAAVERAIDRLNYGTVTVNHFSFASYYFQVLPWGGFPGNHPGNIQSGVGRTANALMLNRVEKSILYGPFRKSPDPVRITSRKPYRFARQLAEFEGRPTLKNMIRLMRTVYGR
jgi:acyl-CoA reductase-like NAD-dependent aldehyde dehydrogenase